MVPPVSSLPNLPNAQYPIGSLVFDTTAKRLYRNTTDTTWSPLPACANVIQLNGGTAGVKLMPLEGDSDWTGLVVFQDRKVQVGEHFWCGTVPAGYPAPVACDAVADLIINGGDSDMEIRGTLYLPVGDITVNGNSGAITLDQMIASTIKVNGNNGNVSILYEFGAIAKIRGVGLVE